MDLGAAGELPGLMGALAGRGVNEVLVEAGATLAGAVLEQGLADELVIYLAPVILGDNARGMFHLPGVETLAQGLGLVITGVEPVGDDWRVTARPP